MRMKNVLVGLRGKATGTPFQNARNGSDFPARAPPPAFQPALQPAFQPTIVPVVQPSSRRRTCNSTP